MAHNAYSNDDPVPTVDVAPRVAIIGCGPSGCFTAQALRKQIPDVNIVVFDKLPTPYGLIRHGIAPDHQGAKAVHRQFDRLFSQPGVRFVGNTAIGVDLSVEQLRAAFDAVVFATGLPHDRPLDVALSGGPRVLGGGELLRLLNSDPDVALRQADDGVRELGKRVVIIGTGNVAVDVARILTKSSAELAASDVDDIARNQLLPHPIEEIHILGRCVRADARWDAAMVKELAAVGSVDLRCDGVAWDPESPSAATAPRVIVDVHFEQILQSISGAGGTTEVLTHDRHDSTKTRQFMVDSVISAVGFDPDPTQDAVAEAPGIFHVGGAANGRLGNLAENRKLAALVAKEVGDFLTARELVDREPIDGHLPAGHVTFQGWKHIDEAETLRAAPQRCRTKFTSRAELLAAASPLPADHL